MHARKDGWSLHGTQDYIDMPIELSSDSECATKFHSECGLISSRSSAPLRSSCDLGPCAYLCLPACLPAMNQARMMGASRFV